MATAKSSASSFCLSASAFFLSCSKKPCHIIAMQRSMPKAWGRATCQNAAIGDEGQSTTFTELAAVFCLLTASSTFFLTVCTYLHSHSMIGNALLMTNVQLSHDMFHQHREEQTYCWTLALLFLFFRPKVLSSATCKVQARAGLVSRQCMRPMRSHSAYCSYDRTTDCVCLSV